MHVYMFIENFVSDTAQKGTSAMTMVPLKATPGKHGIYIFTNENLAIFSISIALKLAPIIEDLKTALNPYVKYENIAVLIHVLQNT